MSAREPLILIADDEERMRRLVGDYLRREGCSIVEAADGREAISRFASRPGIDLAIIDVMMPNLDGWVALRELKARSSIPVLMLTAKSEEEDELFGFGLGADEYIRKPVSPRVLVARVKALLRRSLPTSSESDAELLHNLRATGIAIDTAGCRVTVDGAESALSPKEFDILLLLASNPGVVYSRDRILDSVWGLGYAGDPRTVDTHMKNLRMKLGGAGRAIETVRGFGYRLSRAEGE
ncbi:MAG: response regulator transcription factor [Treponema sp.]|nr:response regulator transcription factor [Treponema sp.]